MFINTIIGAALVSGAFAQFTNSSSPAIHRLLSLIGLHVLHQPLSLKLLLNVVRGNVHQRSLLQSLLHQLLPSPLVPTMASAIIPPCHVKAVF